MKFAQYLQESQTPEWKKAYIDYGGLKVQLGIIRAQAPRPVDSWSSFGNTDGDHTNFSVPNDEERYTGFKDVYLGQENATSTHIATLGRLTRNLEMPSFNFALTNLPFHMNGVTPDLRSQPPETHQVFPVPNDPGYSPATPLQLGLQAILSGLPAIHVKFFNMLDAELGKVETFYAEREKEMHERAKVLRKQLDELAIHRKMFNTSSARSRIWSRTKRACLSIPPVLLSLIPYFRGLKTKPTKRRRTGGNRISELESGLGGGERCSFVDVASLVTQAASHRSLEGDDFSTWKKVEVTTSAAEADLDVTPSPTLDASTGSPSEHSDNLPPLSLNESKKPLDPLEYQRAKRRLRNAVFEHYRGLELLNNYRVVNLAGFRKVLKKYVKITKVPALDAYTKEKIEPCAFASGATVGAILKEMETLFAMRFEHGDRKRAIDHLRVGSSLKTRHLSTFRSGIWLGLAAPAIGAGFYQVFQENTRASFPSWNILLYIYSALVLPVLLAVLIGINILAWAQTKISYVFIFKLNLKSRLDHREYFELPSFFLCTLSYAFWFSFAQIGSQPMIWPMIWLGVVFTVMLNPFHKSMWGGARWWTIKKIAKLVASGVWVVEFTDVWLGDQFCSLTYTLSHLYFVGCFYTRFAIPSSSTSQPRVNASSLHEMHSSHHNDVLQGLMTLAYDPQVQEAWSTCGATQNWEWYCFLGLLPFIVRLVQNLRRYRDSKLPSQLINAGKYASGIIEYTLYCYWRSRNGSRTDTSYFFWCLMATVYSLYGCGWDVIMDWSMCQPHSQYPLLRLDLVYSSHISWYYFALASNLLIRFVWVVYIFIDDAHYNMWAFIIALLEMLRRVQWNFFRLEGKHLHNMGLHRITREVPLPYPFDAHYIEYEAQLRKRMARLS